MEYDKKFDDLRAGTIVTGSYTAGRTVFKGVITTVNREHPDKPPYFVKLNKEHPEKSLWFYPWEIISAEFKDPSLRMNIRAARTMEEVELIRRAGRECAGVNRHGHPVDRNGEELPVNFDNLPAPVEPLPDRIRRGPRPPRPRPMQLIDMEPPPPIGYEPPAPENIPWGVLPPPLLNPLIDAVARQADDDLECPNCGRDLIPREDVPNAFERCRCENDDYNEEEDLEYDPR